MSKRLFIRSNHFSRLLLRLAIVLIIFTICRLTFYIINYSYFEELTFNSLLRILIYGLRFDISAILILNIPLILLSLIPFRFRSTRFYNRILNTLYISINSLAIAVNLIDVIYFRFTFKRTTADILNYLGAGDDFAALIPQFLNDFWFMVIIWIVLIIVLILLFNKVKLKHSPESQKSNRYYFFNSIIFLLSIFFMIIGIRGGFQLRPLSIMAAGRYADAKNVPMVLNTPYTFLSTLGKSDIKKVEYFDNEVLNDIYNPEYSGKKNTDFVKKNIIIIMVESLSLEHIGSLNASIGNEKYKGYTPFLDSLIRHSRAYRGFANSKRSIDGIPAILSGIPSLMNNAFIISQYAGNKTNSIANLLKEESYYSAFFHGGSNGTMGFDNYTNMAGFDNYYGRNEYNNEKDFDGKWGIFDEEFLQYSAKMINTFEQPFFAAVFTLSSHHPYTIPEKHKERFKGGKLEIQKCIQYVDYSLMRFFKTISKMDWFSNTLFVITADHTSEAYYPYYNKNIGMFAIPIIFYDPDSVMNSINPEIAQQIDILPSIMEYLNYNYDFITFGTSVFDTTASRFSINYLNNSYQLIKDGFLLQFEENKSVGLFDMNNDSLMENNLINIKKSEAAILEKFAKAVIQHYNNRMIDNKLTSE